MPKVAEQVVPADPLDRDDFGIQKRQQRNFDLPA